MVFGLTIIDKVIIAGKKIFFNTDGRYNNMGINIDNSFGKLIEFKGDSFGVNVSFEGDKDFYKKEKVKEIACIGELVINVEKTNQLKQTIVQ